MDPSDAVWAESAWRMHQLQAAAQWLRATRPRRGGPLLIRLLRAMERLRAFVDESVLLANGHEAESRSDVAIHDAAHLVDVVSAEFDWQSPSRETFVRQRESQLQRELDAVAPLHGANSAEMRGSDWQCLRGIIKELREREQSRPFHRGLLLAVRAEAGAIQENTYSTDNFAYGSTPFDSWVRVCASQAIQRAVQQWPLCERRPRVHEKTTLKVTTPIVVVGSSSGSLVFYTAALLGHACTGVEILPFLHTVASDVMRKYKPENCELLQADVLATELHGTRLIILTSQCWDDSLYAHVLQKLEDELACDSIVIDYRDGPSRSKCFEPIDRVENLRVSWNPAQTFFIYRRR